MSAALEFATDPIDPSSLAQAVQELTVAQPSLRAWLLIDAALLEPERLASALRRNEWTYVGALATTPLAAYGTQGPQLLEIPLDDDVAAEGIRRLVSIGPEAPAFSWLVSNQPIKNLQACFGYLAQARQDGLKLHCRMSDTRVLPALLATLSGSQTGRVAQTIAQWQWFDRDGTIVDWLAPVSEDGISDTGDHLELDALQFSSLINAAEADGIFAQLLETVAQLVPRTGRALFHRQLQGTLGHATDLGVTGNPDRLQFVVLSLTCGEDFYKHPALSDTWQSVAQGASLTALMKDWSDVLWNALENRTQ
ncbi:DUF4123 domain-containing protein [Variovorax sp. PAMC26660]|uniref:DUF4123 domain-containing protein n=1 Tax=Variovorax sp. PAMC26660 TaxID=2762322 RepID=UPI00164D362C|nr:DUF4123 domain-containing protein [Variovorax sp. PAMC26660]QNK67115.1 DUF4123 domain-containing protein [Variovorax sp. PAMC26660]